MAELSDIKVVLNVETPATVINMGVLALFVKSTAEKAVPGVETFYTNEDFQKKYGSDESVSQVGEGYFDQASHGEKLLVITYTDSIAAAAETFYNEGWEFATVAGANADSGDAQKLVAYIDGKSERLAVIGLPATTETVATIDTTKQVYGGFKRAILFASGTDANSAAFGAGALVGALGNRLPGAITWKFKALGGVTPTTLSVSDVLKLHEANIFTYVTKAKNNQTSEGFTASGEFIDALQGDDWIKASLESSLQALLAGQDKLTYDANGIALIYDAVTQVLTEATNNGVVLVGADGKGDFRVTTKSRAESSAADISARKYNGLSFSYTRAGAIHSVTVNGTVEL